MRGIIADLDMENRCGIIYGIGSVEQDGKEIVIPEYRFGFNAVVLNKRKMTRGKIGRSVAFLPCESKEGRYAKNISFTRYRSQDDPRLYLADRIDKKFELKIPCIAWMNLHCEEMKDIYYYLRAEKDRDVKELIRLSKEYSLSKVPKKEWIECIASGGACKWNQKRFRMVSHRNFANA